MKAMRFLIVVTIGVLALPSLLNAQTTASSLQMLGSFDAVNGETVFREKGCFGCHSYDGWGGMFGPDLGTNRIRGTSPSALAAAMWNQAPYMWRNISGPAPTLTVQEAAALYSFFYSRLYFNDYPDTPHGEDYFKTNCSSCHDLRPGTEKTKAGPPVSKWGIVKDPMVLTGRMWNHATAMLDRMNRESKSWPRMTGQDVTDLLGYFWRLPEVVPETSPFRFGNDKAGEDLFNTRCNECHTMGKTAKGRIDLSAKLRGRTLPELAATMWSHAPQMKRSKPGAQIPTFTETEIRDLMTYLVIRPVFSQTGNSGKGSQIFQNKKCGECHEGRLPDTGAPALSSFKGPFDAVRMTTVLWSHGPAMLAKMKDAKIAWPRFNEVEMLDLLTYLNRKTAK